MSKEEDTMEQKPLFSDSAIGPDSEASEGPPEEARSPEASLYGRNEEDRDDTPMDVPPVGDVGENEGESEHDRDELRDDDLAGEKGDRDELGAARRDDEGERDSSGKARSVCSGEQATRGGGATERTSPVKRAPAKRAPATPPPLQAMMAGAVLGGAIGDAMGHPTEFISSLASIRGRFGPKGVTRFELYWERGGKRFAPYTDDTQMAEIVLRTLIQSRASDDGLDATMQRMAEGFIEWSNHPQGGHRAPGNACMAGCRALARGAPWFEAGGPTAGGCGSVMRAYPFGLVFADDLQRAERWSVAHSKLTHRDPIALASCAAMAVGMARIVRGEPVITVASEMVAAACRYSAPTAMMMATAIDEALSGVPPEVTLDRLRAWAAHEAIAAAVYLFMRHPDSPAAAILEGANTPGDSDSIATLAGAMVGARCGIEAFPGGWVRDVERSSELLDLATQVSLERAL